MSLGCAEGEEVYTMAFISRDEGVEYDITGVDACSERIEIAKRGVYSLRKLRTMSKADIDRYFEVHDDVYRVKDEFRKGTSFLTANIVNIIPPGTYDFIFLRRVLIYLDEKSVGKVLREISYRLKPEGYLILGRGEIYQELLESFEPVVFPKGMFWKRGFGKPESEKKKAIVELAVEMESKSSLNVLKELMNMGFYEQVEYLVDVEMNSGRDSPELWKYLITALVYKGDLNKAREKLAKALLSYPDDPDLRRLKKVVF